MSQNEGNKNDTDLITRGRIQHSNTDGSVTVSLQQLRIKPGLELTLLDKSGRILSHKAQFVAAFENGVLLTFPMDDHEQIEMRTGESYHFSGFTGKFNFTFTSEAIRVDHRQFNALVSHPPLAAAHFVRKNLRAELMLPATILSAGGNHPVPVVISNLSIAGAGIDSSEPLGEIGDEVTLLLQVKFERKKEDLKLAAIVRHITETGGAHRSRTGLDFVDTSQNDKLLLHYHINTLADGNALN